MSRPLRAMVMAAGAGTRLRPLTHAVAKPMVPVAGKPVLEYTLLNLKKHGIRDVILNLHAFPDQIRSHFGDGSRLGLNLSYSHEPELLGTAGGVKKVEWFLKDATFLVMSGDGLATTNLTDLIGFHRKKQAVATMALSAVDSRFEYGVALTNAAGRIQRFVEKPSWGDVFSNQVNSGIYVFEPRVFKYIPKNRAYDFGKQVWPALLKKKELIFAKTMPQFWCDIGNLHEYRRAHHDLLRGVKGFEFPGQEISKGVRVGSNVHIDVDAILEAPCWVGSGSRIEKGAHIRAGSVIGENAHIGAGALIHSSILWDHVTVGKQARLENCIVGHGTKVPENAVLYEGVLI